MAWAVAAFVVILAVGGLYFAFGGDNDQVADPTVPNPTTVESEVVHGWPSTLQNPAGLYSWDGDRCAGQSCNIGFMHNGQGSGDVDLQIHRTGSEPVTDDSATAVTVAGHEAVYQRIDDETEKWTVDVDGQMFSITLTAEPGTSQADLAEAHAIIDSIRTEPSDNSLGYRVIFTLTTDDWGSG
jgi:hypothetical protein